MGPTGFVLEGTILKTNMVLSGKDAAERADAREVAEKTVECLKRTVPAAVPGIAFLSGGQGDEEATVNLDAINRLANDEGAPWELSFSYGRGLQAAPLKAWGGDMANMEAVQQAYFERACKTAYARQGAYDPGLDTVGLVVHHLSIEGCRRLGRGGFPTRPVGAGRQFSHG